MKKIFPLIVFVALSSLLWTSCKDDDSKSTWEAYTEWRENNETWLAEQEALRNPNGTNYYERVVPAWNRQAYVLVHWFNDRKENAGNLTPMLTSTIEAAYKGRLYNDEPFDSATNFVSSLSGVIEGWQVALMSMHVGDTVQIIIPYALGYGSTGSGAIPPYSALQFNMRLKDIPFYETRP